MASPNSRQALRHRDYPPTSYPTPLKYSLGGSDDNVENEDPSIQETPRTSSLVLTTPHSQGRQTRRTNSNFKVPFRTSSVPTRRPLSTLSNNTSLPSPKRQAASDLDHEEAPAKRQAPPNAYVDDGYADRDELLAALINDEIGAKDGAFAKLGR
ncbi:hypothetical protein LTR17_003195 [Elasticomyces elasticus]|nr:hypothetical protein LTR17_003195 [Elasticomyces elasticus]